MSTIVGDNRSRRDDETTAFSFWSLNTKVGNQNDIKYIMDDDTTPLSVQSKSSGDHSIISDVTPRVSNCVIPTCTDFEVSDLDKHGIASCVVDGVTETSFHLVDGCVLLNGSCLLDEFFSPAQVQSLQNTFQEVSAEIDAAADAVGTTALSLVQDLSCDRLEMANELIEVATKAPRNKKMPRTIRQHVAARESGRRPPVPIREVRIKSHSHHCIPSQQVGGPGTWFARPTPSQGKESSPHNDSPPKGVTLLRKMSRRLGRDRPTTKTVGSDTEM
jgi:hypothetical protein